VKRLVGALALAAGAAGCAARQAAPAAPADLEPARQALEAAREAGAEERAPEAYGRARGHLNEAEALAAGPASGDQRRQSEWLGRLATVEAQCAAQLAQQQVEQSEQRSLSTQEAEKRSAQLRRHEDEQRRLEEQVALLKRDLELTENEVIRTKSRVKGIETKAEASSAIAEIRILLVRIAEERGGRSPGVLLAQEALEKADEQLREENYGAAIFFAQKAQDAALKAREGRGGAREPERSALHASYTVKSESVNLRKGPGTGEAVLAKVAKGTQLKATGQQGDWIRVEHAGTTGWIHRSLLE
jgi:hypothetical protein